MALDILIVDDESDICTLCAGILEDEGYSTRLARSSDEVFEQIKMRTPSMVLLDIWIQGSTLDGIQILETLKQQHPSLPIVMMSGHGTVETAVKALKQGAYDFIEKPFKSDRLLLITERAIETARLREENEALRRRADTDAELVGSSASINQLHHAVAKAGPSNSRVLISGASGVGKEVVARALHGSSARSVGPFIVVNCAAMEPDRMEVELFGTEENHGEGRSEGGGGRKIGTFEAADNGTLLLDEVGDMPIETQGKIVRVLQEQIFKRVGGTARIEVDVRVIATTTRDLTEEIKQGRFREDLYYRLSVVPLTVPPLIERRTDIVDLANHFMTLAAERVGQPPRPLGDDVLAALQTYQWPGNVRELRNVIESLLIMAPGGAREPIRADMLPAEIIGNTVPASGFENNADVMSLPLRDARERFEREYLFAQIDRFGGNVSKTATFVGMERSALHRKLKSLGYLGDGKASGGNGEG